MALPRQNSFDYKGQESIKNKEKCPCCGIPVDDLSDSLLNITGGFCLDCNMGYNYAYCS